MLNKSDLFPIGIGSWGLGGFAEKDSSINESKQVNAVSHMLNAGMNYVEVNHWYSEGYSAEILGKALNNSNKKRNDIFICQAIYLKEGSLNDVEAEVDKSLKLFGTQYIDTLQFTMGVFNKFGFDEVTGVARKLLDSGKSRFTSITNENLELLQKYHNEFGDKLFSHEVCFNFEIRDNEKLGMIPYANENKILTVVYQPLRRNRTANLEWPLLTKLAKKYNATQNQILLKWITSKGYLPLTKSETINHINEHIDALQLKIDGKDFEMMDLFSPPSYVAPKIDWNKSGDGVSIDQLSNIFDEEYSRQKEN